MGFTKVDADTMYHCGQLRCSSERNIIHSLIIGLLKQVGVGMTKRCGVWEKGKGKGSVLARTKPTAERERGMKGGASSRALLQLVESPKSFG